jgi:hypothetical protein
VARPKRGEEKGGNTACTMFRLTNEERKKLEFIRDVYSRRTKEDQTMTSVIRTLIRREADRIKKGK